VLESLGDVELLHLGTADTDGKNQERAQTIKLWGWGIRLLI
jgi:hypothetical protein